MICDIIRSLFIRFFFFSDFRERLPLSPCDSTYFSALFQITPWQRMGKLVPPQFHQRLWCNQKNCPSVHPCSRRSCTQARQCCSRPVVVQTETPIYQFSVHVALPKSQSIEKQKLYFIKFMKITNMSRPYSWIFLHIKLQVIMFTSVFIRQK